MLTVVITFGVPSPQLSVEVNAKLKLFTAASVSTGVRLSATGYFGESPPQVT